VVSASQRIQIPDLRFRNKGIHSSTHLTGAVKGQNERFLFRHCADCGEIMSSERYRWQGNLDFGQIDYLDLFDTFDQGVLMTDMDGMMVYYNETQA